MRKHVLVAVRPKDVPLVRAVLHGHFDFTIAHTLRSAEEHISDSTRLIVCGVHFDQGAMFDLLKNVKAHPAWRTIPFILILKEDTVLPGPVIKGICEAAQLLGAEDFIDLGELLRQMDQKELIANLRERVGRTLDSQAT